MIIKPTRMDIALAQIGTPIGFVIGFGIISAIDGIFNYATLIGLLIGGSIVILFSITLFFEEIQQAVCIVITENEIEGPISSITKKRGKFAFTQITEVADRHPRWLITPKNCLWWTENLLITLY